MDDKPSFTSLLSVEDIRDLLIELARRLAVRQVRCRIYVVGGAALALEYYADSDRRLTTDVDAGITQPDVVEQEAAALAEERGIRPTWLSRQATAYFPPNGLPDGKLIIEEGEVCVYVAPADLLLAMKLRAARLGRDDDDIAVLVRRCDVRTDDEAQAVLDRFYDREIALKPEAIAILEATRGSWTISTSVPPMPLPALRPRKSNG